MGRGQKAGSPSWRGRSISACERLARFQQKSGGLSKRMAGFGRLTARGSHGGGGRWESSDKGRQKPEARCRR
jgi:hypothetical protein